MLSTAALIAVLTGSAQADDVLKLAVGAPNNWDSGVPDVGQRAGIFKKYGLALEILYTNGGGETMQAVTRAMIKSPAWCSALLSL